MAFAYTAFAVSNGNTFTVGDRVSYPRPDFPEKRLFGVITQLGIDQSESFGYSVSREIMASVMPDDMGSVDAGWRRALFLSECRLEASL
jgi:hypothetical protein